MKFLVFLGVFWFLVGGVQAEEIIPVASFKGMQVTGITISDDGRMFVNFPRWREGVPYSVAEIMPDGYPEPYPDTYTNSWEIGDPVKAKKFICVQSVWVEDGHLYVLDTKNPMQQEIVTYPTVYVYELANDKLVDTYFIDRAAKPNSYVNDLRVDLEKGKIYFTDSAVPGLIVLDMDSGDNYRVLDNHRIASAEVPQITVSGVVRDKPVHTDGIALDKRSDSLYFHALTGYTLYGVPTEQLIENDVNTMTIFRRRTAAPDGMITDERGNIYYADLENNRIQYLSADRKEIKTLAEGTGISWADTFAIHDGYLYFTNSRIHEVQDGNVSQMIFTVNKVKLPD